MVSVPKLVNVKELRILFSPIGASSAGVRSFIEKSYASLRNSNAGVKFMIREGNSVNPRIYARYAFGKEAFIAVDGASQTEILDKIRQLGSA